MGGHTSGSGALHLRNLGGSWLARVTQSFWDASLLVGGVAPEDACLALAAILYSPGGVYLGPSSARLERTFPAMGCLLFIFWSPVDAADCPDLGRPCCLLLVSLVGQLWPPSPNIKHR